MYTIAKWLGKLFGIFDSRPEGGFLTSFVKKILTLCAFIILICVFTLIYRLLFPSIPEQTFTSVAPIVMKEVVKTSNDNTANIKNYIESVKTANKITEDLTVVTKEVGRLTDKVVAKRDKKLAALSKRPIKSKDNESLLDRETSAINIDAMWESYCLTSGKCVGV